MTAAPPPAVRDRSMLPAERALLDALRRAGRLDCPPGCTCRGDGDR